MVGIADRPLELYAVVGRRTAAYTTTVPTPDGTPFCLVVDMSEIVVDDEPTELKVDLVNGATVWYTFEQIGIPPIADRPQS